MRSSSTATAIPVLDTDESSLVGWLTHQRVLSALYRRERLSPPG